jgi:hypothetical protein
MLPAALESVSLTAGSAALPSQRGFKIELTGIVSRVDRSAGWMMKRRSEPDPKSFWRLGG